MRLSIEGLKELISDEEIKSLFLKRKDIRDLKKSEQELRWREHLINLNGFREFMSGLDTTIIYRG